MRSRTLFLILAAVAIAVVVGFTTATFMSGGGSNDVHTMSNGHTMTGGMSMGAP